jgi:hypothetical protein
MTRQSYRRRGRPWRRGEIDGQLRVGPGRALLRVRTGLRAAASLLPGGQRASAAATGRRRKRLAAWTFDGRAFVDRIIDQNQREGALETGRQRETGGQTEKETRGFLRRTAQAAFPRTTSGKSTFGSGGPSQPERACGAQTAGFRKRGASSKKACSVNYV